MVVKKMDRRILDEEETKKALRKMHQDGHLGVKKTLGAFRKRFQGTKDHAH